jgi:outer membrane protein with beta-barrel domain
MRILSSLLVVALVGVGSPAMAQGVSGGVKGGVGFATLSDDASEDVDLDSRTGIVAGGFVTWSITERFSLQLEGLFTQKGAAFNQSGVTGTTKLDYFEVPLLFVSSTAPSRSGGTSLQFFAGPSIAFKVSAKGSGSFQGETVDVDIPDEDIESVDLGVVVGAGVTVGHFLIEGRYTVGLSNINGDTSDPTKVKNRSLAILAGVRF